MQELSASGVEAGDTGTKMYSPTGLKNVSCSLKLRSSIYPQIPFSFFPAVTLESLVFYIHREIGKHTKITETKFENHKIELQT
jgi:hypothetical protein